MLPKLLHLNLFWFCREIDSLHSPNTAKSILSVGKSQKELKHFRTTKLKWLIDVFPSVQQGCKLIEKQFGIFYFFLYTYYSVSI